MSNLAEANAILEAQRAHFSERAELEREAQIWRDATPEECFATVIALCEEADHFLSLLAPEQLALALRPDPSPAAPPLVRASMKPSCGD